MSRMTAAQVISLGEYLSTDFDPGSLTVSQLLGVLGYHNIPYPTPYSKPKLVQLFNDEIKAKATKWKKDRVKKENSLASDEGIIDGATGEPLRKERVTTRSSRRLSRVPLEEDGEISESRPEPPKRRRSSAQPVLSGPSRKVPFLQEAVAEESEPEEQQPRRKVGRNKKITDVAGSHNRRVSNPAEDSGWEDNNIFQSGAESSSPARLSPVRPRVGRKSLPSRKSRKSTSAPPEMLPLSPRSPLNVGASNLSPPSSIFEPQLLPTPPLFGGPRLSLPKSTPDKLFSVADSSPPGIFEELKSDELDVIEVPETIEEESQGHDIQDASQAAAAALIDVATFKPHSIERDNRSKPEFMPYLLRLIYVLFGLAACHSIIRFKMESASIGYCDAGSNTSTALDQLKSRRIAVEACNRENRTYLYQQALSHDSPTKIKEVDIEPCPLAPLFPWFRPETCTPCPDHATCSQFGVACDTGYILRSPHLLFFLPPSASPRNNTLSLSSPTDLIWRILSEVLDGLPGLGGIALPPRCVEDPKRKRHIGALGKGVESLLGRERGRRLCSGKSNEPVTDMDGGDAKKWGYELEGLRDMMRKKAPPHLLSTFDDTFNEAIQQLTQWGGVIIGEDRENHRYVSHRTPDLTWHCVITVKSRELWAQWKVTVFGIILMVIGIFLGRARASRIRRENKRVAELVQIALDTLRNQELAYHTDPVTAVQPYLSSLQLRDLILQNEHSVSSRTRLWNQVERIVEGNANVRANLEEIAGGDEMRVWRWVGSAGRVDLQKEGPIDHRH